MSDYATMTDDEFLPIRAAVEAEYARRQTIQQATDQMESIITGVQRAMGREPGDEWVQPTGAHDAYPRGWVAEYRGVLYESLIPANTTVPGSDSRYWKDLTPTDPESGPREWSAEATYTAGDLVTRGGVVYRALLPHGPEYQGTWGPPAVGVWEEVRP